MIFFPLGGVGGIKAKLQLFRVPWRRRKTDVSSYSPKIHNDQCLSSILLCPSCDCLIRCWFTQSWDTRKQGCKPQRQRKSNACSASFCISKAQRGHPVLRSKTHVSLPISQTIKSLQHFHMKKKKKTCELFQSKMLVNSPIILHRKSRDWLEHSQYELPGRAPKPCKQGVPFHLVIQVQAASGYHTFFWGLFVCFWKKNTSYFAMALFLVVNWNS